MKSNVLKLSRASDLKKAILEAVGDLSGYTVLGSNVLLAAYIRPEKTSGGIIMPENRLDEDRFQGTVSMILKMGPEAFKYVGGYAYEGPVPEAGQWVMHHASDVRELFIRKTSCKLIDASLIRMIVPEPASIY